MMRTRFLAVPVALCLVACGSQKKDPVTGPPPPGGEVKPPTPPAPSPTTKKYLKVHMVNVGQGDGIIVECPDDQVGAVIDSADSRNRAGQQAFEKYLAKLMEEDTDKKIPLVVATHPHSDHIGHLKWVVETYGIGVFVDNGQAHSSMVYRELMTAVKTKGMPYMSMDITPPAGPFPSLGRCAKGSWKPG